MNPGFILDITFSVLIEKLTRSVCKVQNTVSRQVVGVQEQHSPKGLEM